MTSSSPASSMREHRIGERVASDLIGAFEIFELLEQRHRAQLAGGEPGGAGKERDLEQVRDLAGEADDVALARARAELAARPADDVERAQDLARLRPERLAIADRCERSGEHLAQHGAPALLVELAVPGPASSLEQLGDHRVVDARVLAQVERREMEPEDVEPAQRIAELALRNQLEAGGAQAAIEHREIAR